MTDRFKPWQDPKFDNADVNHAAALDRNFPFQNQTLPMTPAGGIPQNNGYYSTSSTVVKTLWLSTGILTGQFLKGEVDIDDFEPGSDDLDVQLNAGTFENLRLV